MAHFTGKIDNGKRVGACGPREVTRDGTINNGLSTLAMSPEGGVRVDLWHNPNTETDHVEIVLVKNPDSRVGRHLHLYSGPVSGCDVTRLATDLREAAATAHMQECTMIRKEAAAKPKKPRKRMFPNPKEVK